jgi:hypothetical protein
MTAIKSLDTNTYTLVIDAVLNRIATRTRLKRCYMLLGCIYDLPLRCNCHILDISINIYTIKWFQHFYCFSQVHKEAKICIPVKNDRCLFTRKKLTTVLRILIKSLMFVYFTEIFLQSKILLKSGRNIWHFAHNLARNYISVNEAKIIFLFQIRSRSCTAGNSRTFW